MVRWDDNSPEISLSLWLVQELPRRGAYASQSPWESIPPESLVGRFLFQPTRDNTWQFVWVPAAKGLSCPIVATVTLDSVGLIHVVEQSSWQDIVFAAVRAISPTQWGNPRALRRVKRNRWITASIKLVIGEVFALPFRWIFLALFVPQHSPSTNDIGFSASMAVFTLVQGVVTIAVPIAVIGGLFRNPKPNCGLAQNPATSPTVLAAWAKSGDAKLRLAVAGNPSTPPETLMHLSKDRFSRDKRTYPIRQYTTRIFPALQKITIERLKLEVHDPLILGAAKFCHVEDVVRVRSSSLREDRLFRILLLGVNDVALRCLEAGECGCGGCCRREAILLIEGGRQATFKEV